jgi:hypothetical protein
MMNKAVQAIAACSGAELITEGDLKSIISTLARDLQSATKTMDDTTIELDFASDSMGARGKLRFRAYRHRNSSTTFRNGGQNPWRSGGRIQLQLSMLWNAEC